MTDLTLQKRIEFIAIIAKQMDKLTIEHEAEKKASKQKKQQSPYSYYYDYNDDYSYKYPYINKHICDRICSLMYNKKTKTSRMEAIELEYKMLYKYLTNFMNFTESKEQVSDISILLSTIKVDKYDLLRVQETLIPF
jgi:hypothetical protein